MTCIVGIVEKDTVFIGADSAGVSGLDIVIRKDPKVFKVGDFVIGCTSSFRMIQLLRFSFTPPKRHSETDIYQYMCTDFINAIRECFRLAGFADISNNAESGGCFLVGYQGRLFVIHEDYQVGESLDGYDSVGCGRDYALGALSQLNKKINAADRINKALETASHFSGGVRPPYTIIK